jgi:hypothetical protein
LSLTIASLSGPIRGGDENHSAARLTFGQDRCSFDERARDADERRSGAKLSERAVNR